MRFFICILALIIICWSNNRLFSNTIEAEYEKASQYLEERGEVCFNFYVNSIAEIDKLTKVISLDKVEGNKVFAYANKEEFQKFLEYDVYYEVLTPACFLLKDEDIKMSDCSDITILDWDRYPTFEAYVSMMNEFESTYPDLCKIYKIGESINGRDLLFAKVTDNINEEEKEPEFCWTSTIHGDETFGYMASLRMIDYLLSNYGSDPRVTRLVDSMEIWIAPLFNPDGTYRGGNSTVSEARRYNANNVDMNRDHPGPLGWKCTQKETKAFVEFELQHHWVMGCDLHGGMEACVYPWAYTRTYHTDRYWWDKVCSEFCDLAQGNSPSGYFISGGGYGSMAIDYYVADGTRADWSVYHGNYKAPTIELNTNKLLPESQLDDHWGYVKESFLGLFEEIFNGVRGTVTDSAYGFPLDNVKVFVENHDKDSSWVYSDTLGDYYRPINEGTHDFTFSLPNYQSKTIENVQAKNGEPTFLDVRLWDGSDINTYKNAPNKNVISITPVSKGFRINYPNSNENTLISIYDIKGKVLRTLANRSVNKQGIVWDGKNCHGQFISNGCYLLKVKDTRGALATSFIVNR